jgi:hypothetical protein
MLRYKVLKPVEHNQVLYVPQGATDAVKTKSVGSGAEIAVNASGIIELDPAAAGALSGGQIAPMAASGAEASSPKRSKR